MQLFSVVFLGTSTPLSSNIFCFVTTWLVVLLRFAVITSVLINLILVSCFWIIGNLPLCYPLVVFHVTPSLLMHIPLTEGIEYEPKLTGVGRVVYLVINLLSFRTIWAPRGLFIAFQWDLLEVGNCNVPHHLSFSLAGQIIFK